MKLRKFDVMNHPKDHIGEVISIDPWTGQYHQPVWCCYDCNEEFEM